MTLYIVLLTLLLLAGIWTVMTLNLLKSAIGLAVTSVVLTLLLFLMNAPLAGVFELSVCAGLITVVFISTISLTAPATDAEAREAGLKRWKRFIFLPFVLVAAGWLLCFKGLSLGPAAVPNGEDVRKVLWVTRRFDLIGQILIVLSGVFGVLVLFKTRDEAKREKPS
jgi:NADH-quinone oxidoreductase subunit J